MTFSESAVYDNSGVLTLDRYYWTNNATRGTSLTTQDGVMVANDGNGNTRRYLGTIKLTGSTTTEDSVTKRYVWNKYNQSARLLYKTNETLHSYSSDTVRAWNNDATQRWDYVAGESHLIRTALNCMSRSHVAGWPCYLFNGFDDAASFLAAHGFHITNQNVSYTSAGTSGAAYYAAGWHFNVIKEAATANTATFASYSSFGELLG